MRDLIALVLLATAVEAGAFVYLRLNKQPIGPMQTFATVDNKSIPEVKSARVSHPRVPNRPGQRGDIAIDPSGPIAKSEVIVYAEDESWNRYDRRRRLTSADASRHPFPTESDFSRGMPRSQILAQFGAPNLTASTSREGNFVESFFYLKPDRTAMTVTVLQNGSLVSFYSSRQ